MVLTTNQLYRVVNEIFYQSIEYTKNLDLERLIRDLPMWRRKWSMVHLQTCGGKIKSLEPLVSEYSLFYDKDNVDPYLFEKGGRIYYIDLHDKNVRCVNDRILKHLELSPEGEEFVNRYL